MSVFITAVRRQIESAREIGFWFLILLILVVILWLFVPLFLFSLVGQRTVSEL